MTTLVIIPDQPATQTSHRQRESIQSRANYKIPAPKPTHRAPVPLLEESSSEQGNQNDHDPRQKQPSGPPNEAPAYELDQSMERAIDDIDWDWLDTYLRELE